MTLGDWGIFGLTKQSGTDISVGNSCYSLTRVFFPQLINRTYCTSSTIRKRFASLGARVMAGFPLLLSPGP